LRLIIFTLFSIKPAAAPTKLRRRGSIWPQAGNNRKKLGVQVQQLCVILPP
jgi:hypothetical protein